MAEAEQQFSAQREWIPEYYWEIERCLPPFFKREKEKEERYSWSWTSAYSELMVHIRPDPKHDAITVYVRDTRSDKTIKLWTSRVQMTGEWQQRLRRAAGESFFLAQRRPKCTKCRGQMEVCDRRDGTGQFFGCVSYPDCNGLTNIANHDIGRKRAVSRDGAQAEGSGVHTRHQTNAASSH